MFRNIWKTFTVVILALVAGFLYFSYQVTFSVGGASEEREIVIEKGDGVFMIGKKLKSAQLISQEIYFVYYAWKEGVVNNLAAGKYEIKPNMTVPEIVKIITYGEAVFDQVKITFPEGWNAKKMATRLSENGFPGDEFLEIVNNPGNGLISKFDFLSSRPKNASLEGFLFPDTYYFFKNNSAEQIIDKILKNFDEKLDDSLRKEIVRQNKNIFEIVTMASVIENEVRIDEERKIVSGIFWKRVERGGRLQSCATLAYILGVNKKQYSFDDTRVDSPYNTYLNAGLPPGPISNPGINSIEAAIYPQKTEYNYFLNNQDTGKTVFSKTIEEHNANKAKNGL